MEKLKELLNKDKKTSNLILVLVLLVIILMSFNSIFNSDKNEDKAKLTLSENIVNDTVDTAEDIIGGEDDTVGTSDSTVDTTQDDDIPDQIEDDAADPNSGKDESDVGGATTGEDPNPNTGIGVPFMTAGLVAVSAAGVAYLMRKRNGFGTEE